MFHHTIIHFDFMPKTLQVLIVHRTRKKAILLILKIFECSVAFSNTYNLRRVVRKKIVRLIINGLQNILFLKNMIF